MNTLAWLLTFSPLLDGHGLPIRAPESALVVIATVADESAAPAWFAAALYVLGAHESAYRPSAVGDSGKSCGAFQTPCNETPMPPRPRAALEQTRLAARILQRAINACPEHPLWMYASGHCRASGVALRYEAELRALVVDRKP